MKVLTAGLLMMATAPLSASPTVVWKWGPDAIVCALRQQLDGTGRFVEISSTGGDDHMTIALTEPKSQRTEKKLEAATITLGPGSTITADGSLVRGERRGTSALYLYVLDRRFPELFSHATTITLSHGEIGSKRIAVVSPAAAVDALRSCEDKKMREWGIDPSQWRALRSRPKPIESPVEWFTTGDYPLLAAQFGVSGHVVTRLEVGSDGAVLACTVVNRQVDDAFKNAACRALKRRGRFHPAIDANGQPVPAPFIIQVRFEAHR